MTITWVDSGVGYDNWQVMSLRIAPNTIYNPTFYQPGSVAVFNPGTSVITEYATPAIASPSGHTSRQSASAALLADGRILVVGGTENGWNYTAESYIGTYNSTTHTISWVASTPFPTPRSGMSIVVLRDGRVLCSRGYDGTFPIPSYFGTVSGNSISWAAPTSETVDTSAGTFSNSSNGSAVLANDGRVLFTAVEPCVLIGTVTGSAIAWVIATNAGFSYALGAEPAAAIINIRPDGSTLVYGGTYSGTSPDYISGTSAYVMRLTVSGNTVTRSVDSTVASDGSERGIFTTSNGKYVALVGGKYLVGSDSTAVANTVVTVAASIGAASTTATSANVSTTVAGTTVTAIVGSAPAAGSPANINLSVVTSLGSATSTGVGANVARAIPAAVGASAASGTIALISVTISATASATIAAGVNANGNSVAIATVAPSSAQGVAGRVNVTASSAPGTSTATATTVNLNATFLAIVGASVAMGASAAVARACVSSTGGSSSQGVQARINTTISATPSNTTASGFVVSINGTLIISAAPASSAGVGIRANNNLAVYSSAGSTTARGVSFYRGVLLVADGALATAFGAGASVLNAATRDCINCDVFFARSVPSKVFVLDRR